MSELDKSEKYDSEDEGLSPACRRIDEVLEDMVDGELEAAAEAWARAHVAGCPRCAAELELAGRIRREMAALDVPCPAGVEAALWRRLEGEAARRQHGWRLLPVAATLAALALLGTLLLFRPRSVGPDRAEIAAAEEQIRLAFSVVGEISHRSARVALDEVLEGEVVQTVRDVARRLDGSLPSGDGEGGDSPEDPRPETVRPSHSARRR